jgi:hypothetical protein
VFETLAKPRLLPSAARYFLQLLICYPAIMLVVKPFSALLSAFGLSGNYPSHVHFAGYDMLSCIFVGPVVSWSIGRRAPSLVPTGRWIWILPVLLVTPIVVLEQLHPQPIPWLPESFFDTGGEGFLAVFFLTLPTCSAIGYSIGMAFVGFSRRWVTPNRRSSVSRGIVFSLASIALFGILTSLLHSFEQAKIESWSKIRYVIDDQVRLSQDPNVLCAGLVPEGPPLKNLMAVESLERRACGGDRLLPPGAAPQPGSWVLERVKVLNGSHAGAEGWVLAYGLKETMR